MTADQHHVGMAFGDSRGDGADTDFGNQLYADARMVIGVLQIVHQLRQIFDRLDIVVPRRRGPAPPRGGMRHLRDPRPDYSSAKLPSLPRLSAPPPLGLPFP